MMKKTKRFVSLLLAGAMTLAFAACGTDVPASSVQSEAGTAPVSQGEDSHYPITIDTFNYAKEPVQCTFEKAPERVIAFWQNSVETMLALGLEDRIVCTVGVTEEDISPELRDAYQKIKDKEYNKFSDSNAAISKEFAVMLQPDFILAWKSSFSDKTVGDVDYWHQNGCNTYMALNSNDISAVRTVENEYQDILTIGKIFNVEEKAEALVEQMKAAVDKATKATEGQEKKTVLFIEFLGGRIQVYDKTMLAGNMVELMGGDLLDVDGTIGAEDIINLDPDVMFVIGEKSYTGIMDDPAYTSLRARVNNQVFTVELGDVYTSGVRTLNGLNIIGKALYPDLYQE